jgi:hypothetical protein
MNKQGRLARAQERVVRQALTTKAGDIKAAAAWLGCSREGVYSMCRRLDIDIRPYRCIEPQASGAAAEVRPGGDTNETALCSVCCRQLVNGEHEHGECRECQEM